MPAEQQEMFKLRIEGPGISVNKDVDRLVALSVIRAVLGDVSSSRSHDAQNGDHSPEGQPPLALREYLDGIGAQTKVAQILAISAFLTDFSKQKDVSRDEIKAMFAEAAEPMPANFPRDFGKVRKAGWLAPSHGSKDRYYVTQSGRAALKRGGE